MVAILVTFIGVICFGVVVWICLRRACPQPTKEEVLLKRFGPGQLPKNERFMKRFQPDTAQSRADLSWVVGGEKHSLTAEVVDLSDDGACIKSKLPLEPEMPVLLQLPSMRLAGTAKVCYCQRTKRSY